MNKKYRLVLLLVVFAFFVVSCSKDAESSKVDNSDTTAEETKKEDANSNESPKVEDTKPETEVKKPEEGIKPEEDTKPEETKPETEENKPEEEKQPETEVTMDENLKYEELYDGKSILFQGPLKIKVLDKVYNFPDLKPEIYKELPGIVMGADEEFPDIMIDDYEQYVIEVGHNTETYKFASIGIRALNITDKPLPLNDAIVPGIDIFGLGNPDEPVEKFDAVTVINGLTVSDKYEEFEKKLGKPHEKSVEEGLNVYTWNIEFKEDEKYSRQSYTLKVAFFPEGDQLAYNLSLALIGDLPLPE